MCDILKIFVVVGLVASILLNKKVSIFCILKEQIAVFKNAKSNKKSWWDFWSFLIGPTVLSLIIVVDLKYIISAEFANSIITLFTLISTIMFGFSSILLGISKNDVMVGQVILETFTSMVTVTVLSLILVINALIIIQVENLFALQLMSWSIFSMAITIFMLLFMIIKRVFLLFKNTIE